MKDLIIKQWLGVLSIMTTLLLALTSYTYIRDITNVENKIKVESEIRFNSDKLIEAQIIEDKQALKIELLNNEAEHKDFVTQKELKSLETLINRNYNATVTLNGDIKKILFKGK